MYDCKRMFIRRKLQLVLGTLIIAIADGCTSEMIVRVNDAGSGAPVVGISVERYRPVSRMVKIFNPIRATYFPMDLAETKTTDAGGVVTFSDTGSKDQFQLYAGSTQALVVSVGEMTIHLSPDTNQVAKAGWGYSVWIENGMIRQSSWPRKEQNSDDRH